MKTSEAFNKKLEFAKNKRRGMLKELMKIPLPIFEENNMKCEDLVKVLKLSGVEILNEDEFGQLDDNHNLIRDLHFKVGDVEYYINWFHNTMKIYTVGTTGFTIFTRIEHSGTWPNNFKRNLQMYYGEHCVCVIGLEKYPEGNN